MPCTPGGTTTPLLGLCKPASGEVGWTAALNGNWDILDGVQPILAPRGHLSGLGLSTAGSSTTMSIAAGQAVDSTHVSGMALASLINKTMSAWAVGNNNGGLDAGSIAANTWYHFFLIKRVDTGVVDVLFSLSAGSPTMPASYTLKRRIGSGKTDGSSNWTAFIQDGDYFHWLVSVLDVDSTNPGTTAVTITLTVPTGINVQAELNVVTSDTSGGDISSYFSDLAASDETVSFTAAPLSNAGSSIANVGYGRQLRIRTNTSAQIRYRLIGSGVTTKVRVASLGWWDRRGRDA